MHEKQLVTVAQTKIAPAHPRGGSHRMRSNNLPISDRCLCSKTSILASKGWTMKLLTKASRVRVTVIVIVIPAEIVNFCEMTNLWTIQ